MKLITAGWTVPKDGNPPEQNEDAFRFQPFPAAGAGDGLLIAVADGASEAVFARGWAQALVDAAEPDWPQRNDQELNERLDQVRRTFSPVPPAASVPWHVRNKFRAQGSQAALLVATVRGVAGEDRMTVRAVAVGDSCLLLCRSDGDVCAFPVGKASDFGLSPALVGSRRQDGLAYGRWEAVLEPGDALLACTDALARWALECWESNSPGLLFEALRGLLAPALAELDFSARTPSVKDGGAPQGDMTEEEAPAGDCPGPSAPAPPVPLAFPEFVQRQRQPGSQPPLRDDDCTLVFCAAVRDSGQADQPGSGPDGECRQRAHPEKTAHDTKM